MQERPDIFSDWEETLDEMRETPTASRAAGARRQARGPEAGRS